MAAYIAGTWLSLPTSWSFVDPRRHPTLNTAAAIQETPLGLLKRYLGSRRDRVNMSVSEVVIRLIGRGDITGHLLLQSARFKTAHVLLLHTEACL